MGKKRPKPIKDVTDVWVDFFLKGLEEEEALKSFFESEEVYVPRSVGDTFRISGRGHSFKDHCVILEIRDPELAPLGYQEYDVKYTLVGMDDSKDGFYPVLGFTWLHILEKYAHEGYLTK